MDRAVWAFNMIAFDILKCSNLHKPKYFNPKKFTIKKKIYGLVQVDSSRRGIHQTLAFLRDRR